MALLTKKEFASKCGMKTNMLSVYIKRNKVIVRSDNLIDDTNDTNISFYRMQSVHLLSDKEEQEIIEHISKNHNTPTENAIAKISRRKVESNEPTEDNEEEESGVPSFAKSTTLLKYLDTKKREEEIALLKLRKQKIEGEVIPAELVGPVLLQQNQNVMVEMKNAFEEVLRIIAKKHDLNLQDVANYRKMVTNSINDSVSKASISTKKAVISIVNDYAEKRGVGEK